MKKLSILLLSLAFLACKKSDSVASSGLPTDPPQYAVAFSNVPDSHDATIYQVNMRVFSAAGNFQGVTARLDSIKNLGVNVIYLMPIHPVGILRGINSPYAVKDYKAVNSEFGTLDDLRALVDAAHSKNMAVILDWVANHTSWDNAWISNKPWYKQDASGNIVSPQGYNDVAQLDFNNRQMRTAMLEAMRYWVFAANIDGYRFDFADNVPFDFWKESINSLKTINDRKLLLFAEGTRDDHFRAGFQLKFGFGFYNNMKEIFSQAKTVTSINGFNTSEYANTNESSQVVRYITNHDVNSSDGTPLDLFSGKAGSMAAFLVSAYMKGVPMIYNGQEVATPIRLTFPFATTEINWAINPDVTAEYKKIIGFRNSSAAIRRGQLFSYSSDDVCVFTKQAGNEKVLVIVNLRNNAIEYSLPDPLKNSSWTDAINTGTIALNTKLTLQPYSYLVLKQ